MPGRQKISIEIDIQEDRFGWRILELESARLGHFGGNFTKGNIEFFDVVHIEVFLGAIPCRPAGLSELVHQVFEELGARNTDDIGEHPPFPEAGDLLDTIVFIETITAWIRDEIPHDVWVAAVCAVVARDSPYLRSRHTEATRAGAATRSRVTVGRSVCEQKQCFRAFEAQEARCEGP